MPSMSEGFREFVDEFAAQLDGLWVVRPLSYTRAGVALVNADGAQLEVLDGDCGAGWFDRPGRVIFRGEIPKELHGHRKGSPSEITISKSKPTEQIAREATRRILRAYLDWFSEAKATKRQDDATYDQWVDFLAEVADKLENGTVIRPVGDRRGEHAVRGVGVRMAGHPSSIGLEFKVTIPRGNAADFADLLRAFLAEPDWSLQGPVRVG